MKKQVLFIGILIATVFSSQAQDLVQNQVPSVILNKFHEQFAKATDIEWEMDGLLYNVEFEIGWNTDHEIWYDTEGNIIKHKEDISRSELPEAVRNVIKTNFKGYTIDDLERITDNGKVCYKMELNSLVKEDWDVVMDVDGTVLSKIAD
ncbi:PepSY-like domain-containing protein [Maribacter thermophilus]|uniref:PepSY-like domain-containing protein n=1 Tax=Maribacter thermophilus TaxID=1197874 RepID=UPI000640D167|nr:PepSY-like domain-containing protein [Maribacter thermophilus]